MVLTVVEETLGRAEQQLRMAAVALDDFSHEHPERRRAAIRNSIVWGRAVTPVLQQLRTQVDAFDDWYRPWREEMKCDPLLRYLYEVRNEILKKGTDPAMDRTTYTGTFSTSDIPPAPPGARAFFIGDRLGGTGWEVVQPDGTIERIYISLPAEVATTWFEMTEAPDTHLGKPLVDKTPETICRVYVEYLKRLVIAARAKFLG